MILGSQGKRPIACIRSFSNPSNCHWPIGASHGASSDGSHCPMTGPVPASLQLNWTASKTPIEATNDLVSDLIVLILLQKDRTTEPQIPTTVPVCRMLA